MATIITIQLAVPDHVLRDLAECPEDIGDIIQAAITRTCDLTGARDQDCNGTLTMLAGTVL